ncbi:MAG: flagellum-specific ATP synthase FliI, partial [Pseudomonadota bacterium]
DLVDEILGPDGLARSVVVAATSDQSPLVRRRCAWTAMTIAEHFRDAGKSVLLVADSITRFAEAHREVAIAAGEAPVLRGYPPSISHLIMSLCERAGTGAPGQGDITAVFSVLVPGSDMDEPIADILRGVLDGHVVLDRAIAERGRFPAVDVLRSVSRSLPAAATEAENDVLGQMRKHLSIYAKNELMISAGLYAKGSDPAIDAAVDVWPDLDASLGTQHDQGIPHSFDQLRLILRRAGRNAPGTKA